MINKQSFIRGAVMGLCLLVPAVVFAEPGGASTADQILGQAHDTLFTLSGLIVNLVSLIMGLVGIFMLAVNLYKYFKGDPSSNDALTKVGAGLLIAVIILQVIRVTMLR